VHPERSKEIPGIKKCVYFADTGMNLMSITIKDRIVVTLTFNDMFVVDRIKTIKVISTTVEHRIMLTLMLNDILLVAAGANPPMPSGAAGPARDIAPGPCGSRRGAGGAEGAADEQGREDSPPPPRGFVFWHEDL